MFNIIQEKCNPLEWVLLFSQMLNIEIQNHLVCRSIAEKGPSTEEKIQSLEAVISNYEVKVSGLEHEIETQREEYEQKLEQFTKR